MNGRPRGVVSFFKIGLVPISLQRVEEEEAKRIINKRAAGKRIPGKRGGDKRKRSVG